MALHRADGHAVFASDLARARMGRGLQSRNGGWGAFDADNVYYYLNNIPFADHGALLDPPTDDVTGRCIGLLMQLGATADDPHVKAGVDFLRNSQLKDGSWFGRWGVNYIYGTWSALAGLNAVGLDASDPMIRRAADWLVRVQNEDGGWGESCDSYRLDYDGYHPAPSAASQTAWALLGLMAAGEVDHPAVAAGIRYLQSAQRRTGSARRHLYRRRLPARVLSALSRLREILSALGGRTLPQPEKRQFAASGAWAVETGLSFPAERRDSGVRGKGTQADRPDPVYPPGSPSLASHPGGRCSPGDDNIFL